MKHFFTLLSLFISSVSFGQAHKKGLLKLLITECKTNTAKAAHPSGSIYFYTMPGDNIAFMLSAKEASKGKTDTVPAGQYKMRYVNIFLDEVVEDITVYDEGINYIPVCDVNTTNDSLPLYLQNTLAKLQDKDSVTINFISSGCRNYIEMKVVITKESGRYIARLYPVRYQYEKVKRKYIKIFYPDSILETTILTKTNLDDFLKFENELNNVGGKGCTTHDWYKIESKYLNIEKEDLSCSNWSGYRVLLSFFHETSYELKSDLKLKDEFRKKKWFRRI